MAILDAYSPLKSSVAVAGRYACACFRFATLIFWGKQWQLQAAANPTVQNSENMLYIGGNKSTAFGMCSTPFTATSCARRLMRNVHHERRDFQQ